jgi:hypothetical protein
MTRVRAGLLSFSFFAGLLIGGWTVMPVHAEGTLQACEGCCDVTTDCGPPSQYRCCLPMTGEANCGPQTCPNYCLALPSSCGF